jgi:hypothetical protein
LLCPLSNSLSSHKPKYHSCPPKPCKGKAAITMVREKEVLWSVLT